MTEIKVPSLGESVTEAYVAKWLKQAGEHINADEPVVELETDKITVEVNAPESGILSGILVSEGSDVEVGSVLGEISPGEKKQTDETRGRSKDTNRREVKEKGKKNNEKLKEDKKEKEIPAAKGEEGSTREERVKMTKLRRRVAENLKQSQNTAAMLTTFNEIDMSFVIELRNEYRDDFEQKYGVRLGFMSFFVKAAVQALREFPAVNAEIDGEEIVYKNYYNIGVAVSAEQGLVVPVIDDADQKSMDLLEKEILDYGERAREGKIKLKELQGGTFTISNGGVFGSLMSTPILNYPQCGILGIHKIIQRPVVTAEGHIEAKPMMYVALTYDHRLIDGREAVTFLVRIKEAIEDPRRILLDI